MENAIQEALDSQWDALESRDIKIVSIRRTLGKLLLDLATQKSNEVNEHSIIIERTNREIEKAKNTSKRRAELQAHLDELNHSDISQELKELNAKISSIDIDMHKLMQQKEQLSRRASELKSIYASRSAKYKTALGDIEEHHIHQIQELPAMLEKVKAAKKTVEVASMESQAALFGEKLWNQVCTTLTQLDQEIHGYGTTQLPQISFILDKSIHQMEEYLSVAKQEHWSVLVVAISHELQLLQETINAVRKYESINTNK